MNPIAELSSCGISADDMMLTYGIIWFLGAPFWIVLGVIAWESMKPLIKGWR